MDLQNEINKLKEEVETIKNDNQKYVTLERQFDDLIKEVRQLEGELADYNLALDKQRSDTKPEDIMAILYHMQAQNERQRHQLDEIFIQRKNKETEISGIEEQIHDVNLAFEERLNELDPDQRSQYEKLREENMELEQEIAKRRAVLDEVSVKLSIAEGKLREDATKERAQQLREEKNKLQAKKEDLQLQTDEMNLPFPEARERLLSKAKEDQMQMKNAEQRAHEIQKLIDSYQKQIKEIESELEENKAETVEKKKYEILQEKDKEYTEYIANFEATRAQEQEQLAQLEKRIGEMLETMSRNLRNIQKPPVTTDANALKGDINFRDNLIKAEEQTADMLRNEVEDRKNQLVKMEKAEEGIEKSSNQYKEKMAKMKNEMESKFSQVDSIIQKAKEEKQRLIFLKDYYSSHKEALGGLVTYASMKVDAKKMLLTENEAYKSLSEQERKIAESEASLFNMKQFIESKKNETNYENTLRDCMKILNGINEETLKNSNKK